MRGQGGCERRIEVFEKIHKKIRGGGGIRGCSGWGSQSGCDTELKFLWKFKKKNFFFFLGGGGAGRVGGGGGVRVDVNEELKFLVKLKKYIFFFEGGGGSGGGVGLGGSG